MPDDDPKLPPLPPGVPRPPPPAEVDLVSSQQEMLADEWAAAERPLEPPVSPPGAPPAPAPRPGPATDRLDD